MHVSQLEQKIVAEKLVIKMMAMLRTVRDR